MKIKELNDLLMRLNKYKAEVEALDKHPKIKGASAESVKLRLDKEMLLQHIRIIEGIEL